MDTSHFASNVRHALSAEISKRGTPVPLVAMGDCIRLQHPDGAVSFVSYNEKKMKWEHRVSG